MKSEPVFFGDLLNATGVTYYVPPFQRNYKWGKEQRQTLWGDLMDTAEKNKDTMTSTPFMGIVIYYCDAEKSISRTIIDGQQRLTTATLLLAAIRDASTDDSFKGYVNTYLLNEDATRSHSHTPKIQQIESDAAVYNRIILGQTSHAEDKNSSALKNYRYFASQIDTYLDDFETEDDKNTALRRLVLKGFEMFKVVYIESQPWIVGEQNPQEIFESINSRGLSLTLAELVRSYLIYGACGDDYNSGMQSVMYEQYWKPMEDMLGDFLTDYIRDFMRYRSGKNYKKDDKFSKNAKELYAKFKEIFAYDDCKDVLREMYEYADVYASIVRSDKKIGVKSIDRDLEYIRLWKMSTLYVVLFDVLVERKNGTISDKDTDDIIKALLVYNVRRRICGEHENENKGFLKLVGCANKVIGAPDKKNAMFALLANLEQSLLLPNDRGLRGSLSMISEPMAKNILIMAEESLSKNSSFAITDEDLQLEHIMPQTLTKEWKAYLGPNYETIYQDNLSSLGNLSLVYGVPNKMAGNKPFDDKKVIYENGSFCVTRNHVTDCDKWDADAIQRRGEWLTEYIIDAVLPIPGEFRNKNNYKGGTAD